MCSTCSRIGRTNSSTSRTMALAIFASLMMSPRMDCASGESGSWRLRMPAMTSMPASGFFTSCAIAAAISPSAASRSRSRSRSSSCSTRVRSLKKSAAPVTRPRASLDLRDRVADDLVGALQPQLGAVRQVRQLERAGDDAGDFRLALQHAGERAGRCRVRRCVQAEDPVGDVVHDGDAAVDGHGEDAVPQAPDEVAIELVGRDAADVRVVDARFAGLGRRRPGSVGAVPAVGGARLASRHRISGGTLAERGILGRQYCNCVLLVSQAHFHVAVTGTCAPIESAHGSTE